MLPELFFNVVLKRKRPNSAALTLSIFLHLYLVVLLIISWRAGIASNARELILGLVGLLGLGPILVGIVEVLANAVHNHSDAQYS